MQHERYVVLIACVLVYDHFSNMVKHVGRNYRREYDAFYGAATGKKTAKQLRNRKCKTSRNQARRIMKRKMGGYLPTNMEVDHKNCNPLDNRLSNLRLIHRKRNRANTHCR